MVEPGFTLQNPDSLDGLRVLLLRTRTKEGNLTSLSKCLVLHGVSVSARCLSSVRCRSSRSRLCSVAFSMSFCRSASVTCCHRRLKRPSREHLFLRVLGESSNPPGLGGPLLLRGSDSLLGDGQLSDVDHFGVAAGVAELQDAVPLALHSAHHRVCGVVLHLGGHPG